MEIGIIMSITKDEDRHVCEELEPRVNYDKLAGDGVYRDAYAGEELLKDPASRSGTRRRHGGGEGQCEGPGGGHRNEADGQGRAQETHEDAGFDFNQGDEFQGPR
eukprot:8493695-Pyramimonas_sp.AAC.1